MVLNNVQFSDTKDCALNTPIWKQKVLHRNIKYKMNDHNNTKQLDIPIINLAKYSPILLSAFLRVYHKKR